MEKKRTNRSLFPLGRLLGMKRKLGVRVSDENESELDKSGHTFAAAKKIQRLIKSAFLVQHKGKAVAATMMFQGFGTGEEGLQDRSTCLFRSWNSGLKIQPTKSLHYRLKKRYMDGALSVERPASSDSTEVPESTCVCPLLNGAEYSPQQETVFASSGVHRIF